MVYSQDSFLLERIRGLITAVTLGARHHKGTWLRLADKNTLHEAINQALLNVAGYAETFLENHPDHQERAKHEILFRVMFDDKSSKVFTVMLARNECQIDPVGFYPLPSSTQ